MTDESEGATNQTSYADRWQKARKEPVEVEFRGPYTDPDTIETIEGDFEVDEEYVDEHNGYVIIRGVQGEIYPCGFDIFRETYEPVHDDGNTETPHVVSELETEAQALVKRFNAAKPDFSPELEWVSTGYDVERGIQSVVFEAAEYLSRDGLSALRESGHHINYIEAYEYDGDVLIQIYLDVRGDTDE